MQQPRMHKLGAFRAAVPPVATHRPCRTSNCICVAAMSKSSISTYSESSGTERWDLQQGRNCLSKALAGVVSLGLLCQGLPAVAEEMSIAFPASSDPEIRRAQQTMVESWAYVQAYYLDPSFSHVDWSKALQDSLAASFKAKSAAEVTDITNQLLAELGDPYTRLLQGDKAAALAAQEQGKIVATGLGLQQVIISPKGVSSTYAAPPLAVATASASTPALEVTSARTAVDAVAPRSSSTTLQESSSSTSALGRPHPGGQEALMVSFVVEGSPAEAAGVAEGDVLLAVGGQPIAGQELRQVYNLLSQDSDVTLLRQPAATTDSSTQSGSDSAQGVMPTTQPTPASLIGLGNSSTSSSYINSTVLSAAVAAGYSPSAMYTVHLKPEALEFEPVQFGTIDISKAVAAAAPSDTSSDSRSDSSSSSISQTKDVGYLKILSFSATAPQEVAQALVDMQYEAQPEHGGRGLAGMIVDLRDNPGGLVEAGVSIAQDFLQQGQMLCIAVDKSGQDEKVVLPSVHTLTDVPLVVLVNKSTASTSELLAGALHDELSAPLIGTTTYGKGRSQRQVQLADGTSTLLVSTLRYFTPQHTEIDQVGLKPDVVCDPPEIMAQRWAGGRVGGADGAFSLLDDPCIKLAAEKLTGVTL